MRYNISLSHWMRLRPIISLVGETLWFEYTPLDKRHDAIAQAKLGDESLRTGPFPHLNAGKGVRRG